MAQNINTEEVQIELITRQQVCSLLGIKHPTFFRYYAKGLTTYRNGDNPKDTRHFFDKKEVEALHDKRQSKKKAIPTNVVIARKAVDNA